MQKPSGNSTDQPERVSVLCVDDVLSARVLLRAIVTSRVPGSTVHLADCGLAAIEAARHFHPDVILLDLHLPDMDGIEVLDALQGDERTRDIPVIVLSGDDTPSAMALLRELGAVDYVIKPFQMDDLTARIRHAVGSTGE